MSVVLQLVFGAVLVEAVVETIRLLIDHFTSNERGGMPWVYVSALVLGVLVALNYDFDFFALVELDARIPYIGNVLSGLVFARGANVVSDIVGKIKA